MTISDCDGLKSIVGKADNAGYPHFLYFHNVFKSLSVQVHEILELIGIVLGIQM